MPGNKVKSASDVNVISELSKNENSALRNGLITASDLREAYLGSIQEEERTRRRRGGVPQSRSIILNNTICGYKTSVVYCISIIIGISIATPFANHFWEYFMGIRCLVPNNYLVWEATRPVSDCSFCEGILRPLILPNLTQEEFLPYAYSSQPIIIKNATSHWPATKLLNYKFLKDLYLRIPGALESVHEDCQFLNFKSNFITLRDVFEMSDERVDFKTGQTPWYVGWSNCHPDVLNELRKLYPRPHFIPQDAEMPNTDFVFLGYEQGAIMHLDYIPRLMWQAQLRGNKTWVVAPTPECDKKCNTFSFYVEPGDAVLVDTRVWYHGTYIAKGEFSLTIQSEYG